MSLLTLRGVCKRFSSGTQALSDLNFQVNDGEFVSLLGPSGCGKSTALRLIAGLIAPDSGEISWSGARPELGFVFQEATLMPWADALTNARLPLDLKGVRRGEADAQAAAALARSLSAAISRRPVSICAASRSVAWFETSRTSV